MIYRTSQAARTLNVSSAHIRRLCEAALIRAEVSDGGQWRIPLSEVERLRTEGVPPAPSKEPEPEAELPADARSYPRISQAPPEDETSREIRDALASVQIATARLERRRIELAAEQLEDSFRERENARLAEARRQREAEDRQRAAAKRESFLKKWREHGHSRIPRDCGVAIRQQGHRAIEAILLDVTPEHPNDAVERLINGGVDFALAPYHTECRRLRHERDKEWVIAMAAKDLPYQIYRDEKLQNAAKALMRDAITKLDVGSSCTAMRAEADKITKALRTALEHNQAKERVLDRLRLWRPSGANAATDQERSAAVEAVRKALDGCTPPTSEEAMKQIVEEVLAPFNRQIDLRVQSDLSRVQSDQRQRDADRKARGRPIPVESL